MDQIPSHSFHCAWCGILFGQSSVPDSHGICPACYRQLLGIPDLPAAELAALPFGALHLADDGTILSYNAAQEQRSRRSAQQVIGLNFFRDVAPCTQVKDFEGRFRSFLGAAAPTQNFSFTFPFPHGTVKVTIAFVRARDQGAMVLVNSAPSGGAESREAEGSPERGHAAVTWGVG